MDKYNKTPLIAGMRCMVIRSYLSGKHFGREVVLVEKNGAYWSTSPQLTRVTAEGEKIGIGWHETALMPLDEPKLHSQLNLERRADIHADPRMANYILGKEAGYNWGQRYGWAKKSPDEPA